MPAAFRLTDDQYQALCRTRGLVPQLGTATPEPESQETKWRNKLCEGDGYKFQSLGERERFYYLKKLQQWGIITELEVHPKYVFRVNGFLMWTYTADFRYVKVESGERIVEDFKNVKNAKEQSFLRNCQMMRALYGVVIKVVLNSKE